jgi:hypothetical protein
MLGFCGRWETVRSIPSAWWKKLLAAATSCGLAEGAEWRTFPDNPHFYLQELPAIPTDDMRRRLPGVAYGRSGLPGYAFSSPPYADIPETT